jgi:hypothetical protein
MRGTEFEIEVTDGSGRCDIRRKRRSFAYDCDDVADAMLRIRRKVGRDVEVTVIEFDGYRRKAKT